MFRCQSGRPPRAVALAAAWLLGGAATAQAGSLNFNPIMLELPSGDPASVLAISNLAAGATNVQIRAFAWTQQGDNDALTPAGDVILSPPEAQIGPGETQVVRLLLRRPPAGGERHYRLLVDELPQQSAAGAITVALHVSLPVIADAPVAQAAALQWRVEGVRGRKLTLAVSNPGNRYKRISRLEAEFPDGRSVAASMVGDNPFVLPGAARHWILTLPPGAPAAGTFDLTAYFETRTQKAALSYAS